METQRGKAIALCRVSSDEQLKNNSLARQNESVMRMSEKLGVIIPEDYIWSGSISSKCGRNMKRKDLMEIYNVCKKDKSVKYIIVDEPDRFMRSIKEAFAWEAKFEEIDVKVMYTDEQLNGDDMLTKMQRFMKYFQAESSNEERARKTKAGHEKAIRDGRYPFVPPLGYRRGLIRGVPEIDPVIGPLLRTQLIRIANELASPTVALQDFNHSIWLDGLKKAPLKMDKWRAICINPFYCGIIEVHKIVDASNPNGLHKQLITKEQHEKIVKVFDNKPKNQKGPNADGNPLYPFNRMIIHANCPCNKSKYNKFVGVTITNGQKKKYEKYKCRGCNMYISRNKMREEIGGIAFSLMLTDEGLKALKRALGLVFEMEAEDHSKRLAQLLTQYENAEKESQKIGNIYFSEQQERIREDLKDRYLQALQRVDDYKDEICNLENAEDLEHDAFLDFALKFVDNLVQNILNLSPKNMRLCKQLLFPDGFYIDENKNVYTPKISPLYRLKSIKNGSEEPSKSLVVRMKRL